MTLAAENPSASENPRTVYMRQWRANNREQYNAYMRDWYQRNKAKSTVADRAYRKSLGPIEQRVRSRRSRLKSYGLTPEAYETLFVSQGGVCAVCAAPPESGKSLHVDHDHATGEVRGLLCFMCNSGLGMFRDNPDLLLSALDYLASPEENN